MDTQLDAIQRQVKVENERHEMIINDLKQRRESEVQMHKNQMQYLNNRKEQIKNNLKNECLLFPPSRLSVIEELIKVIDKAIK
jgi:hypothetical protein